MQKKIVLVQVFQIKRYLQIKNSILQKMTGNSIKCALMKGTLVWSYTQTHTHTQTRTYNIPQALCMVTFYTI